VADTDERERLEVEGTSVASGFLLLAKSKEVAVGRRR
jgi:hypothetical protein